MQPAYNPAGGISVQREMEPEWDFRFNGSIAISWIER